MKKVLFTVLIASAAFTVRTFFVVDAAAPAKNSAPLLVQIAATPTTPPVPETLQKTIVQEATVQIPEKISFESLNKLNDAVDPEKSELQPYYIQAFMLPGTGSYFAATNVSADTLTAGSAHIGTLNAEDGGTIEGTLSADSVITQTIEAAAGLTLYDKANGNAYCIAMSDGAIQVVPDKCAAN